MFADCTFFLHWQVKQALARIVPSKLIPSDLLLGKALIVIGEKQTNVQS